MPPNLEPKMGPLTQRPLIFSVFLSPNAPGLRGLSLTYVSILYVTAEVGPHDLALGYA